MEQRSLRARTLFITGASRGIGLAIALRAAKDGANIAIVAKTASPHPLLPGTIYILKTQTALSMVEKISAVTLRVANMEASVRFYKDVLGLEITYGGEGSYFTSLRTKDGDTILNLEHGNAGIQWGRLIFHVSDVDRVWAYLMEKGFYPDSPQDASWGERYFHMPDPDGHELSFARPF